MVTLYCWDIREALTGQNEDNCCGICHGDPEVGVDYLLTASVDDSIDLEYCCDVKEYDWTDAAVIEKLHDYVEAHNR